MALRRLSSLCLFCQCRQSVIGRRRVSRTAKQNAQTAIALRPEEDGIYFDKPTQEYNSTLQKDAHIPSLDGKPTPWPTSIDPLSFEALSHFREQRQQILRKLSNQWPPVAQSHLHNINSAKGQSNPHAIHLPEAAAAPMQHSTFRHLLLHSDLNDKTLRRLLRAQLLRCHTPRDLYRVIAVAMMTSFTAQNLAILYEPITRAFYRCRNTVSDPKVLESINVTITRFRSANVPVHPTFLWLGLRFAARTRSLASMKRYLRLIRDAGIGITANVFRSVIAKFSIGHRGLGERRNGRWKRSDLLQVLKGFDDCAHLPQNRQYHLGAFLDRSDWQYLHGWVAVLARCRDVDGVWNEWEYWKRSPPRCKPRRLGGWGNNMTSRKRGDYWFVEQMTFSGDLERAWRVVREAGLPLETIKGRVKMRLLDAPEFCGQKLWEEGVREAMVEKFLFELKRVERGFGVEWQSAGEEESSEGRHVLVRDQWEVMERLAAEDWKLEEDFGFPYENEGADVLLVTTGKERALHEAEEEELAGGGAGAGNG